MNELALLDTIQKINPWYLTRKVPEGYLEKFERRELPIVIKTLDKTDLATMIAGARRVGKSVLMYQVINYLIERRSVNPQNIFFIQGDNPILIENYGGKNFIYEIMHIYEKYFLRKNFSELIEVIYVFIDEAQNIPAWEREVKSLIDLKYKIKFIITGSSSSELKRGSTNPLTGRIDIQVLTPFSFSDYLMYESGDQNFQKIVQLASEEFKEALIKKSHVEAYSAADKIVKSGKFLSINKNFDNYLFYGGFPWVISNKKTIEVQKYLRDLMTTTISKDIMAQAQIREPQAFERLMVNLSLSASKVITYKGLADILGIDERSVSRYVDYYCESHWVSISSPFNFRKRPDSVKTAKKVFVIDPGIINTLAFKDQKDIKEDRQFRGQLIENVIYNHLLSFKYSYAGSFQSQIPFWIEDKTSKEIDFILEIRGRVLAVESKSKKIPDKDEIEILKYFMKDRTSVSFGIITTENSLEIREKLLLIPYSVLCLLL